MNRYQYINKRIKEGGYKSYLEIGVDKGNNFTQIVCDKKIGVDPDCKYKNVIRKTSDDFFASNNDKFDIIFIDGLHTAEQVEKDIVNSMERLNKGGVIILHDINPPTYESQLVPRHSIPWKGSVWRAMVGFIDKYKQGYTLAKTDSGLGVIEHTDQEIKAGFISDIDYNTFDCNRYKLLNIID
jgi:hypothetical protein